MNKKLLTFGILSLFAIAMVSALVVNYLSNSVSVDFEVQSPMVIENFATSDLTSIQGGENVTVSFDIKNLASVDTYAVLRTTITNTEGLSATNLDVESITVAVSEGSWSQNYGNVLSVLTITQVNATTVTMDMPRDVYQKNKGAWHIESVMTLKPTAIGNYQVSVQMIP